MDLDKGGTNLERERIYYGPSIGWLENYTTANEPVDIDSDKTNFINRPVRPTLSGNLDLYVNDATGNDNNTGGLTDPFATIQAAADYALSVDADGWSITIHVASGNYDGDIFIQGAPVGLDGGQLLFKGDEVTPANVTITGGGTCVFAYGPGTIFDMHGFKFVCPGQIGLLAEYGAQLYFMNCEFGNCSLGAGAIGPGAFCGWSENGFLTVSSNMNAFLFAFGDGATVGGGSTITINLVGPPNFTTGFVWVQGGHVDLSGPTTFVGTATGPRFVAEYGGRVTPPEGSSPTYLPGSQGGTVDDISSYARRGQFTSSFLGTISSGSIPVLDISESSVRFRQWFYTNNGAHTLIAPNIDGTLAILVTNGASAGTITFTGFTKIVGDALDTVNGHAFMLEITRVGGTSLCRRTAMF